MTVRSCQYPGHQAGQRGFTLLELLAAITVAGLLLAVSVPSTMRFYDSMQYRQAVRDVVTALAGARYRAINSGHAQDVTVDPQAHRVTVGDEVTRLPAGLAIAVQSAGELNRDTEGVIRFYPEGGSSGGGVDIQRADGSGTRILVDWLLGRVTQERYAPG